MLIRVETEPNGFGFQTKQKQLNLSHLLALPFTTPIVRHLSNKSSEPSRQSHDSQLLTLNLPQTLLPLDISFLDLQLSRLRQASDLATSTRQPYPRRVSATNQAIVSTRCGLPDREDRVDLDFWTIGRRYGLHVACGSMLVTFLLSKNRPMTAKFVESVRYDDSSSLITCSCRFLEWNAEERGGGGSR
ncbi:hypothetical protein GALMADRAFT_148154 [Galerina marginata CBS 339.88]|uniref:Uncharacterized protein n=1 Tax=Galerina marginata (strain CBS 339.88) TaxID=685588 RepID=A0A067S5K8_GALM3|nr:hypothetical protein GALMADRAFT_148154 [Galerina marginata CBS 339.88]